MQRFVTFVILMSCLWITAPAAAGTNAAIGGTSTLAEMDAAAWKKVQRLDPGVRVKVSVTGTETVERYFVIATDAELIVLNLSSPNLPKRQLLSMATDNPAWIAGTSKTTYRDSNLRIGPDGIFVKDQKLADLAQVVERIARDRIMSVAKA